MSVRRSARIAAKAAAPAPVVQPATAKPRIKKAVERAAHYERLVREDPDWAAYDAKRKHWASVRAGFQAGERSIDEQILIAQIIKAVVALQTRIANAADLKECATAADALWDKQQHIEWRDDANGMFLTDCRRYCNENDREGAQRVLRAYVEGMF